MILKKRFFTGITSTGTITIGHYLGIIKNILNLQKEYEIIVMIGDLHALNNKDKDNNYLEKCYQIASLLYSCGLKKNCKIFIQSEISGHLELAFFLFPHVTVNKLADMIQYKEKKKKNKENLSLLSYPVLMAADIFLYDSDLVIVGKDQKEHLELSIQLCNKFNNFLNEKVLKIPEFLIPKLGNKIMNLKNPEKKMSKSENDSLFLLDEHEILRKKIMNAKTDSDNEIYYDIEKKPGISNLLTIYALLLEKDIKTIEKELIDLNYNQFKIKLIETIDKKFSEIRNKYLKIMPLIAKRLEKNHTYLNCISEKKIDKVKKHLKLKKN